MGRDGNMPSDIRAIAVALRYEMGLDISDIATRLGRKKIAFQRLFERIEDRCESRNLHDLLSHIGDAPRSGRPRVAEPGDAISIATRIEARDHPEEPAHQSVPRGLRKRKALGELDPNARIPKRTQIDQILKSKEHSAQDPDPKWRKPIVRNRAIVKNELTERHIDLRRVYCDEEIPMLYQEDVIVVCADEKTFTFGGSDSIKKKRYVPQGTTPHVNTQRIRFKREAWTAACGSDTSIERPIVIWEVASKDIEAIKVRIDAANKEARNIVEKQRAASKRLGTKENDLLNQVNQEVDQYRAERARKVAQLRREGKGRESYPPTRHRMTAERLFPHVPDAQRVSDKPGLDFGFMMKIYEEDLFPYVDKLRANNPGKRVVIQEDNDGAHIRARGLLKIKIAEGNYEFIGHPPNSPQLAPIESVYNQVDYLLDSFRYSVKDATAATKDKADARLSQIWKGQTLGKYIERACGISSYLSLATRCRKAGHGNGFKDDPHPYCSDDEESVDLENS